jgi:hypothetical protein
MHVNTMMLTIGCFGTRLAANGTRMSSQQRGATRQARATRLQKCGRRCFHGKSECAETTRTAVPAMKKVAAIPRRRVLRRLGACPRDGVVCRVGLRRRRGAAAVDRSAVPFGRRRSIVVATSASAGVPSLSPSDELVDFLTADAGGRFGSLSTGIRLRGRFSRGGWSAVGGVRNAGGVACVASRRATCDESTQQIPRGLRRRDAPRRRAFEARARLTRPPALFQLIDLLVIVIGDIPTYRVG